MAGKSNNIKLTASITLADKMSNKLNTVEKSLGLLVKSFKDAEASAVGLNGINISINVSGAIKGLEGIKESAETASDSVSGIGDADTAVDTSGAEEGLKGIEEAAEAARDGVSDVGETDVTVDTSGAEAGLEGIGDAAEDAANSVAGLGDTEVTVDPTGAEEGLKGLGDTAKETEESVKGVGKTSEETAKQMENAFEGAETALAALGFAKIADGIIDKFREVTAEAMEFEVSMAKVATIASPDVDIEDIKHDIEELSDISNKSVNDLAEASYQAISASVDTAKSVAFVGDAVKLAEGGFTEAATSVDVLTTAINAYKLSAKDASRISDILVNTQNLGKTTVDQLAGSMGSVIPLAAAYGVEIDQLAAGYVELTRQGIDTAMAGTYLRGMLQELGDSGSKTAGVLKSETGMAFADLMAQGYSLGDVLGILGESVDGNSTAFVELWSNIRASTGALALYNAGAEDFNSVLDSMTTCIGATDAAYEKMTDTTAHAKEGMDNAISRLGDAVGSDLNPALRGLYELGDSAFTWMAEVVEECPEVTAVLAGLSVGVITFGGLLTVLAVGQIPAVTAAFGTLTAVMMANPVIAVGAAVAGLTAGLIALASATSEANDPMKELTATSKKQQREIDRLQIEYDRLCSEDKGLSEEALRLKYQIDDLTASFEANRKTLGDVVAEGENLKNEYDEIIGSFSETTGSIEGESAGVLSLIQKLEDLAEGTETAADKTSEMEAVYNRLSEGLNVSGFDNFSDVAEDLEGYTKAAKAAAKVQKDQKLKSGLMEDDLDYEEQIAKEEQYIKGLELMQKDAEEARNKALEAGADATVMDPEWDEYLKAPEYNAESLDYKSLIAEHQEIAENLRSEQEKTEASIRALAAEQQAAIDGVNNLGSAEETAASAFETAKEVAGTALSDLETAYSEVYNAAYESINGQIGLFDEMETKSELSVENMIANLDSQTEYLQNYSDNLAAAKEMGLDEGLIKQLSDGSAESAGYLQELMSHKEMVDEINNSYRAAAEAKAQWAVEVASQDIDISEGAETALTQMYSAIEQMDISDEARALAEESANAYIAGLTGMDTSAVAEMGAKILEGLKPAEEAAEEAGAAAVQTENSYNSALDAVVGFATGMQGQVPVIEDTAAQMVNGIETAFEGINLYDSGANAVQGAIDGMNSKRTQLESAAAALGAVVSTAFNGSLDINSPSRVMYEAGEFTAEGAIRGIEDMLGEAENAGRALGESFSLSESDTKTLQNAGNTYQTSYGGDTVINVDMSGMRNIINSDDDIESIADKLENLLTQRLYSRSAGAHA